MRGLKLLFQRRQKTETKKPAASLRERLLFAALVLLPLLYLNIDLIRMGFKPSEAGLSIQLAETSGVVYLDDEEDEPAE